MLRVHVESWTAKVKKHVHRPDENPWVDLMIGEANVPASGLWPIPTKLKDHPEYFWTIVATVDTYLLRVAGSKSSHVVASDIVRVLIKVYEYAVHSGYYSLQDLPQEQWDILSNKLADGGWVEALDIRRRVATLLSGCKSPEKYLGRVKANGDFPLNGLLLSELGTNIATRELIWPREMIRQAIQDPKIKKAATPENYSLEALPKPSVSMLMQTLRPMNLLADPPSPWGISFEPYPDIYIFSKKHGIPNGQTETFTPDTLASILMNSYAWILERGAAVVDFVSSTAAHLALIRAPDARPALGRENMTDGSWAVWQHGEARTVLQQIPERLALEEMLGKKITTFRDRLSADNTTSVNAILNAYYSSAFAILAFMNARRKDEVCHSAIGLYRNSVEVVDDKLGIYATEFYIEKTCKDYVPFFINDITRVCLQQLSALAEIAWAWEELFEPGIDWAGRAGKLFVYPRFACDHKGIPVFFEFNTNPTGQSAEFLRAAIGDLAAETRAAPHMFRKGYGVVFHYRYENKRFVALSQKYGHVDPLMQLTYISDMGRTPLGKRIAALWSTPITVVSREQKTQSSIMEAEIRQVGLEKLATYVRDMVTGSGRIGGGFGKLIARFHAMLLVRVDYSLLDANRQTDVLRDALVNRGHFPVPLRHVTCCAGDSRHGAACAEKHGKVAREHATPVLCSGCAYSVFGLGHLDTLKADEQTLSKVGPAPNEAVYTHARNLEGLRRVIALQSRRLGVEQ